MAELELQATCCGLPLVMVRPLEEADTALVTAWLATRRRQAWIWVAAWCVLIAIPCGIPLVIAAGFLLPPDAFHFVLLLWALLTPLACFMGLALEAIWPTRPWTRYATGLPPMSGALGITLNRHNPGTGDPFILFLFLGALFGIALFILKVSDRSKLVRPSRVRKDLQKNEVWEFASDDADKLHILPLSGLLLRPGKNSSHGLRPLPIQMAAPIPRHRWEIPAYGLIPIQKHHQLTKRQMKPSEIEEGQSILKAHRRRGLPALALLGILSLVLVLALFARLQSLDPAEAAPWGQFAVSGLFWSISLASLMHRWKMIARLKLDLANASLVVVRDQNVALDSQPLAEVLPASRIVWTSGGRIGPLRQRYLKRARIP